MYSLIHVSWFNQDTFEVVNCIIAMSAVQFSRNRFFPQVTSCDVHAVTAVAAYHLVCCSVWMPDLLLCHSPTNRKVRPASPSNPYIFTSPNSWISIKVDHNNQFCIFQTLRIKDTHICWGGTGSVFTEPGFEKFQNRVGPGRIYAAPCHRLGLNLHLIMQANSISCY